MTLRKMHDHDNYKERIYNLYHYCAGAGLKAAKIEVSLDVYDSVVAGCAVGLEYNPIEIEIGDARVMMVPNGQFEPGSIRVRKEKENEPQVSSL